MHKLFNRVNLKLLKKYFKITYGFQDKYNTKSWDITIYPIIGNKDDVFNTVRYEEWVHPIMGDRNNLHEIDIRLIKSGINDREHKEKCDDFYNQIMSELKLTSTPEEIFNIVKRLTEKYMYTLNEYDDYYMEVFIQ